MVGHEGSGPSASDPLSEVRLERLGEETIRGESAVFALLAVVTFAVSLTRIPVTGLLWITPFHTAIVTAVVAVAIVRNRLPLRVLKAAVVSSFFLIAALGLLGVGLLGVGFAAVLAACFFACASYGPRPAYALLVGYLLLVIVMAVVVDFAGYHFSVDANTYVYAFPSWMLHAAATVFVVVPTVRFMSKCHCRLAESHANLVKKTRELEQAISEIQTLRGILRICAWCKKIHNGVDGWEQMEKYVSRHSEAEFSHGLCPECAQQLMQREGLIES
jgi:hypothetical protein